MNTKAIVVASLFLTVASGCATREERRAAYRETCTAYGYSVGTTAYANCVRDRELAGDLAREKAINDSMEALRQMKQKVPIQVTPLPQSTTTRCVPDGFGGTTCRTY